MSLYNPRALAEDDDKPAGTLGRIALKQVRVTREEMEARTGNKPNGNPMNALVPYLDLFSRLDDAELARLARVEPAVVAELRKQVEEIDRALAKYVDLLARLGDGELTRLTGASAKTIRFWRLCNARSTADGVPRREDVRRAESARSHAAGGEATPGVPTHTPVTRTPVPTSAPATSPPRESVAATGTRRAQESTATVPGFDTAIDDDEIKFALIDDDEQAVTQAQSVEAQPTASEEEDDLAFELSDDDFF